MLGSLILLEISQIYLSLFGVESVRNVLKMHGHFACQMIFKYVNLMLIFQNNTNLWTKMMDFLTFIFDH